MQIGVVQVEYHIIIVITQPYNRTDNIPKFREHLIERRFHGLLATAIGQNIKLYQKS